MTENTSPARTEITLPSDKEIQIVCRFAAPAHAVYAAYTTPELVKQWWAGVHGVVTVAEIDLRVGGKWRYVLESDHGETAFHGEYREIVPNERIVCTEIYEMPDAEPPAPEDEPVNIVTFEQDARETTLRIVCQYSSTELRDMVANSGMESGMDESMDMMERAALSTI